TPHEVGRHCRQPVELIFGPAEFDRDILALDEASFFKALAKSAQRVGEHIRRLAVQESDRRHRALLRVRGARREQPRSGGRGAERSGQAAAAKPRAHSITSSAIASSVGGTVRPSVRAIWWLMTSSNLVDCTTGRSAGLVPLRMRAT